jgi:UDP:flavonoid glycosyltransferase YjiC (YdhE family)
MTNRRTLSRRDVLRRSSHRRPICPLEQGCRRGRRAFARTINEERARFGLPPVKHVIETHSELATISQQPAKFDFPRRELPASFHYTGPFLDPEARPEVPFPWERLDGRPPVYASLGTLQNGLPAVFRIIAEACVSLDVQLVMGLGRGLLRKELGDLPGNPLVFSYVPQLQLLERVPDHLSLVFPVGGGVQPCGNSSRLVHSSPHHAIATPNYLSWHS